MEEEYKLFEGHPDDQLITNEAEKEVYDFLDEHNIKYRTLCHPSAFTMEECEKVRRHIHAPVFKNLFLTNKQQSVFYLLMMPAHKPFKTKYLSSQIGCSRLSFAPESAMVQFLNIHPGAVSPMGLIHDKQKKVRLIVDKELEMTDSYACHPCVNTASVAISLNDLLNRLVPATGHEFTWVELPN